MIFGGEIEQTNASGRDGDFDGESGLDAVAVQIPNVGENRRRLV